MFLKCFIAITFSVIYIYTVEYVPSRVRGFAVGVGSAMSRIGGIATPYAMVLFHRANLSSPYWFMFGTCAFGLVSSLIMKEVDQKIK